MSTSSLTIQPVPYFAAAVLVHARPAVEAHKRRRFMCAPEVTEFPDDICHEWAEALIHTAEPAIVDFIQCGTKEDIDAVLAFFCDAGQAWPAHRRAFFNRLHTYAALMELEGRGEASDAFAYFMRERYMPKYFYAVERRAAPHVFASEEGVLTAEPARTPSPATPSSTGGCRLAAIDEGSQELHGDEDDSD